MAFWGMGLTQSDEFCEVYDEYMDMYEVGVSLADTTSLLLQKYQNNPNRIIPNHVYIAIAKAEWDLGGLSESILSKVDELIESGENINYYQSLGFSKEELDERRNVLLKFQKMLRLPQKTPQKRKVPVYNKIKRLPKGTVSWYCVEDGYYGFVVLDAIYEGRLLAITEKLSFIPKSKEEILNAPALTAIWLLLRTVPKGNHALGTVEIKGNYNGRAGVFVCKPVSFGVNFSFYLDECHRRVLLDFSKRKICDLLHEENVPIKFFNEESADKETKLVLELMKNPASNFAKEMIREAIYLKGFCG